MSEMKCPGIVAEEWERQQEEDGCQADELAATVDYDAWSAESALWRLTPELRRELFRSLWQHELAYLDRLMEERRELAEEDPRSPYGRRSQGVAEGIQHVLETLGLVPTPERPLICGGA